MTTRYDKEVESSFSPDATKWQLGSSQSDIRLKLNENRKYTYSLFPIVSSCHREDKMGTRFHFLFSLRF